TVGSRALDVLSVLVERAGELVTKEEIMAAVWRRSVVENANLTVQIAALRRVLDQGRAEGSCVQTVAARGYRFIVPVTRVQQEAAPSTAADEAIAALPAASEGRAAPDRERGRVRPIAAAVTAVVAIAGLGWWVWPTLSSPTASTSTIKSTP